MEEISAIIVTHNSESEIGACLDALRGRARTVVVDNASTDGTVAEAREHSWVEVIENPENHGFAGAINDGVRRTRSRFLLFLNPDAVLQDDLGPMQSACSEQGLAGGCLTGPDGEPQRGFAVRSLPVPAALIFEALGVNRIWPRNPVNRRYRCLDLDLARPHLVEQPAGAFLMVRRDVFTQLGGMDEQFWPVWFEDVDFCRRAVDEGFRAAYVPGVRAIHAGGHSVRKLPLGRQRVCWYGSLLKYAGKHFRWIGFRAVCFAVIIGSLFRMFTGMLNRGGSDPFSDYGRVIRLAASGLVNRRFVFLRAAASGGEGRGRLESRPVNGR